MKPLLHNPCSSRRLLYSLLLLGLLTTASRADNPPAKDPTKETPTVSASIDLLEPATPAELRILQEKVKETLKKVVPCTVGLQVGGASGSGVIINKEGHILTAGHVSGAAGRPVTVILPDGKRVKGETLGANRGIDSGLIKITEKVEFPFLEMGKSESLKRGQWCIAVGHPGGFRPGRTPVVRVGRVQDTTKTLIRTDCTLVGGDSGGPLFDLDGKVIGIHSRISGSISANIHVPVDTYRETWERLAKAEVWGGGSPFAGRADAPYLGIERDDVAKDCKVKSVTPKSAAEKAGIKANDVIVKFDGKDVGSFDALSTLMAAKKIGDKVALEVRREKEVVKLEVTLGKREAATP